MKDRIVKILFEGRLILDVYEKLGCPTEGEKYDKFLAEMVKLFAEGNIEIHKMEHTMEWLVSQQGNNLPKSSSGSIHTALSDFDNFNSGIEEGITEMSDEEYKLARDIHEALF